MRGRTGRGTAVPREPWVVSPGRFVQYLRETTTVPPSEVRLPTRGILVFGGQDFRMFARLTRARTLPWATQFAVGHSGNVRVVTFRSTIGAPAAALNLEEAIALGLRRAMTFGACGSMTHELSIGSVVLPSFAYSGEGTSRYYGGARRSKPDSALTRALGRACERLGVPFRKGGTWTMDAPYRESRAKAKALSRVGVVCVEMEASALFQVARLRGIDVASLFVVSDELDGPEWNQGFGDPRFLAAKRRAATAVLDALAR